MKHVPRHYMSQEAIRAVNAIGKARVAELRKERAFREIRAIFERIKAAK